jgi:hypothetical protein
MVVGYEDANHFAGHNTTLKLYMLKVKEKREVRGSRGLRGVAKCPRVVAQRTSCGRILMLKLLLRNGFYGLPARLSSKLMYIGLEIRP